MRVHPTTIKSSGGKWPIILVAMLIVFALLFRVFHKSGKSNNGNAQVEKTQMVVVVTTTLSPTSAIMDAQVRLEKRPINTLPADVCTRMDEVVGNFPIIAIPAGYPVARSLLTSSNESVSNQNTTSSELSPSAQIDPVQARLEAVYPNTVGVVLPFLTVPPGRGSRIALSLQSNTGRSVIVSEEAWVEEVNGSYARVRVAPHTSLFLEEAKGLGTFSALVIPLEGASPFVDLVVRDIYELNKKLSGTDSQAQKEKSDESKQANADEINKENKNPDNFASYAWVSGDEKVYAVGADGKLHTINKAGEVAPLSGYRQHMREYMQKMPNSETLERLRDGANEEKNKEEMNKRVETGLGAVIQER